MTPQTSDHTTDTATSNNKLSKRVECLLLLENKLIEEKKDSYKVLEPRLESTDLIDTAVRRNSHVKHMELASKATKELPVEVRHNLGSTLGISRESYEKIVKKLDDSHVPYAVVVRKANVIVMVSGYCKRNPQHIFAIKRFYIFNHHSSSSISKLQES